jgi:hypothetical protein
MLSRASSNLSAFEGSSIQPNEQDVFLWWWYSSHTFFQVPLNVPKKNNLYLEQCQRERENAITIHRVFQRELYWLFILLIILILIWFYYY